MTGAGPLPAVELLRPSPWKPLALLAVSAGLVWVAIVIGDRHPLIAWTGGGVFAALGLLAAVALLPGASQLRLDADGLEVRALFRVTRWRWCDVVRFGATRVGLHATVGIDFAEHVHAAARLRRVNRGLSGFDGALPDTYGQRAADLAARLEAWRRAFG